MQHPLHVGVEAHLPEYEIITEEAALEALAKDLSKEEVVAVDTEADSFYHYFDKTCLVQIGTRKGAWLVDPLALGGPAKLAPLGKMFASPKVRVLFHAGEYDLFVLKRDCGFEFKNIFDTMISAQLLGYPAIGLAALVEHHFGVKLPKDEQRSDWSRRPLTDKQLSYAVSDVTYLIELSEKLEKELEKAGRLAWAQADFKTLADRSWPEREFDKLGYLRIKGAKALDPVSLAALRELFLMRDERARDIDRPPFKVLGNRTLLELARLQPAANKELAQVKGVSDLIVRRMGADIIAAVKKASKKPHGPIPKLSNGTGRKRMDRRTERLFNRLKDWRAGRSQELKLDPGVLCPNAALEAIAWKNPKAGKDLQDVPELKSWFAKEFGAEIVEVVETERQQPPPAEEKPPSRRRRR
jgi:ribonuclease D